MSWRRVLLPLAALASLLQMCRAEEDIRCTVTQGGGQTTYRVPGFEASRCHYSWTNRTEYVLANHEVQTDKRVASKSNTTLTINGCSELIRYSRDCISEGGQRKATCQAACSEIADPPENRKDTNYDLWITVAVSLFLLLLLLLGIFLCYKFRSQIFRKPSCIYSAVKTENDHQEAIDLEATTNRS